MPTTPDYLIEVSTRHQIFLEGNKTRISNTFASYLVSISKKIEKQLASKDLTEFNKSRLEKLLKSVNDDILDDYQKYYKVWKEQIIDLSEYEAGFEVRTLEQVIDTKEFTLPSKSQLTQAVMNTPLSSIQGITGTESLKTFYDGWSKKTIDSTTKIIRDGFYIGKTTPQIVREIKGTRGAKFKDGQLARGNKELSILTRTAVQHAAVQSREEVWRNNSDIVKEVEWVSTLDGRTSAICRSLDGQKFPIDSGPRPPAHPGACKKGTMISLKRGIVPIEDVLVGDYALTHTGEYKRVYAVMARKVKENIVTLIDNYGRSVSLTKDHPVFSGSIGWINAGDINVGDVMFNDRKKFNWFDVVRKPSFVPYAVLIDSYNTVPKSVESVVPYDVFSFSAGMSSSINLNDQVAYNKIANKNTNYFLKRVTNSHLVKNFLDNSLMLSRIFLKNVRLGSSHFHNSVRIISRILLPHSIRSLFVGSGKLVREFLRPMIGSSWLHYMNLTIPYGIKSGFNFYSMRYTELSKSVVRKPILSLYHPKTFASSPVLIFNKVRIKLSLLFRKIFSHKAYASTCTKVVEEYCNEYTYNLSVESSETFFANGILVHNCRSTVVASLDSRYSFLDKDATRSARGESGEVSKADADDKYYEWLKTQGNDFQNEVLGKKRAEIFRDGDLSVSEFKKLSFDEKGFKQRTLEEMKELEPLVFKKAGV